MSKDVFNPTPIKCYEWGGAKNGELNPGKEAVAIGARFHGAWLTAYMIRRFGPPNSPSDDNKDLCSWTITTPMKGLALLVTPYLADQGDHEDMCLHFGYRWSSALRRMADAPRRKEYAVYIQRVWKWAKRRFVGLHVHDGGDRTLVDTLQQKPIDGVEQPVIGIYWAGPHEDRRAFVTRKEFFAHWGIRWMLSDAYQKARTRKPRKMPVNNRWPEPMIVRRCNLALRASIRALLQPIWVRDVCFNANSGYVRDADCPGGKRRAEPFEYAGWACRVDK